MSCTPVTPPVKTPLVQDTAFTATGESPLPEQWWLSFEDPALTTLIDQALSRNFSLRAAWQRLKQAEALSRQSGAELSPSLDLKGNYARSRTRQGSASTSGSYLLGLVADYEIDLWGRVGALQDAAELDALASWADQQSAMMTLSAQVASSWYQLVEQNSQLLLVDEQNRTNRQVLELIELRFRAGKISISDVLQQRQLVEANQGERAQILARSQVLKHQLAILTARPVTARITPRVERLIELPPLPVTGMPADLVRRRPDLASSWLDILATDRRVAAAIAERFPRLSLTAQLDTSGTQTRDLFDNWFASLAANLLAPVLDGGQRKAVIEQRNARLQEELATYGQSLLEAIAEVEDALARERQQAVFIASLDRQLDLSTQVIERVQERYIKGAEDYQRVLTALLSHQQLQRSRLIAQRDLILQRVDLCRALGGGWEAGAEIPGGS